jgi:hypothetical protein
MNGVMAVEVTGNSKVGRISITKVSITGSCDPTCPFMDEGCYGQQFRSGMQNAKLQSESKRSTPEELAQAEADAIGMLSGKLPMRLHEFGDCRTNEAASIVARASKRYSGRHLQKVWTYTHAWRKVLRKYWGGVSVLASCETAAQCAEAMRKGYAASIVVDSHAGRTKAYTVAGGDGPMKYIPCPEQTGKTADCTTCKLCWDDKRLLKDRAVIVFAAHGQGAKKVKTALVAIALSE